MIDFLLALLQESPLLFIVLMINIVIVAYIVIRITMYVMYRKKPGKVISHFIWKMHAKKEEGRMQTVEEAYAFVTESLRKEGLLGKQEQAGLLARKKILKGIPAGHKRDMLRSLFETYEAKAYGNRRITNEAKYVSDFLNRYTSL